MAHKKPRILVTRPEHQADALCGLLDKNGYEAVHFPTLKITAINHDLIKQQIKTLNQYQWLIFISANAINFALNANDGKTGPFQKSAIAAIGKATESAVQSAKLSVALTPKIQFNSEGLLKTPEMTEIKGKSCLIIRGQGGQETLANTLRKRGATVDYMEVYTREIPTDNTLNIAIDLQQETLNAITITSGDALKNLLLMVENRLHDKLITIPLIVISSRIKKIAEELGFKTIVITDKAGDKAIIKAVMMICPSEYQQHS